MLGSNAVSDLRFQAATRHAVSRTNQIAGPEIDIAGLTDFGRPYAGNFQRRENHYQAEYAYTRSAGKHLWKLGATVSRVTLRTHVPDAFGGTYLFAGLSDFLAGAPDQFRQAFGNSRVDFPVTSFGGFAQDHWSIARRLTIDLGVRYDFEHLPAQFNEDTTNFSPRIGLAWSPVSKWVFRAGFGIFFDRYVLANLSRVLEKNADRHSNRLSTAAQRQTLSRPIRTWPRPTANRPAPAWNTHSLRSSPSAPTISSFMV